MVFIKSYENSPIDKQKILRYAGVKESSPETEDLLTKCLKEAEDVFTYKVCYTEFDISKAHDILDLGFTKISSEHLSKNLCGCDKIVIFAATIGAGIDRLISKYSVLSVSKALMFQAIGTERIENLCERFNKEIKESKAKEGFTTTPRFSPGYGDLSLETQTALTEALDTQRKIGVTLTDSLLMFPSKSVTAIIGLKKQD